MGGVQNQHADEVLSGPAQVQQLSKSLRSAFVVMARGGVVLDGQRKHIDCLLETPADPDTHIQQYIS